MVRLALGLSWGHVRVLLGHWPVPLPRLRSSSDRLVLCSVTVPPSQDILWTSFPNEAECDRVKVVGGVFFR